MKKIFTVLAITFAILFVGQANALSQVQDPDIVCTQEYAPVCGVPYFECPEGAACMIPQAVTYSNKCMLEAAGATFQYEGVCEQDKPVEPRACPEYWAPVCGKTQAKACLSLDCAQHFQTYSNISCLEADDAEFQYEGECKDVEPPKPPLPEPTKTKYYVGDTKTCEVIDYMCEGGWQGFSDDIGCGCEKKSSLSPEIQDKLDAILTKFFKKLEAKNYQDETNTSIIQSVIERLENLSVQKPRYKDIVEYLVYKLEEFLASYDDIFFDLEEIFKDF